MKIRERLAHDHRHDDECNEEEEVQDGAGEERQDIVEVEDSCDDAVYHRDASLDDKSEKQAELSRLLLDSPR